MKESKHMKSLFVSGGLILFAVGTLFARPGHKPHRHGTDILHFFVNERMTNTGVIPDASGRVDLRMNQQGNANHQGIHIDARNLETNATYQLSALLNDDTNSTSVLQFNTDMRGNASINLEDKSHGKAEGDHPGKVKNLLPTILNPITNIRELSILDSNSVAVLTADVASADRFEILVKRDLGTNNVDAILRLKANSHKGELRLDASGLSPSSDYSLALNGNIAQTESTDSKGRVKLGVELQNPMDVLALGNVSLLDNASNVVASTTLP